MPSSAPPQPPDLARGRLGSRDIVFFVVAAAAPLTVMAAVAPIAVLIGGVGAPAGYLAAGIISTVFAAAFTRMAPHIRNNGAFYSYVQRGLGRSIGLAAALVAVVSYNLLQFSVYGLFGAVTATTAADLAGVDLPWWAWALVAVAVVGVLGYRSVHVGARVLGVLLVLEVLVLLVLSGGVLVRGGAAGLSLEPFAPQHVFTGSMGAVLAVAFAAFVGFEATALYRDEARDPDRTVPRATYVAVGFLSLFYCFIVWIAVMAFGVDRIVEVAGANPAEVFFTAMTTYVGSWATTVMRLLIVTSGLAALLAFHNSVTRYGYALGRESVVPRAFGAVHAQHRSPHVSSVVQTALAAVVVILFAAGGVDPVLQLAAWTASAGTLGVIGLQALTSFSVAAFFTLGEAPRDQAAVGFGVAGGVLLLGALGLVVHYIDLATLTKDPLTNAIVVAAPLVVLIGGVAYATWLRVRRPAVFALVGSTDPDGAL